MMRLLLVLCMMTGSVALAARKSKGPGGGEREDPCGGFLLGTPNTLPVERASPRTLEIWNTLPSAREFVQIFHDVENFFRRAPREVRDFLGLIPSVAAPAARPIDDIKAGYMVPELEVFFEVETETLAPTLNALIRHPEILTADSQTYMQTITAHPSRLFVVALVLTRLREDLKSQATKDSVVRQADSGFNWLPQNSIVREAMLSTSALVHQFVLSFYRLNRRPTAPQAANANDNSGEIKTGSSSSDESQMLAWVAEQLHARRFRGDDKVPPKWNKLLREAVEFLNTPVRQGSRRQDIAGVKMMISQLTPDAMTIAEIYSEFESTIISALHQFYGDLLKNAPVGDDRTFWNEQVLDFAFSESYLAPPLGVSVFAALINLSEPVLVGKHIPSLAINALRRLVIERMHAFYPPPAILPGAASETADQLQAYGPHYEDFTALLFEEEPLQDNTPSNDNTPRLEEFADEERPLNELKPDTLYETEFERNNARFIGDQRLIFEVKALEYMFKEMAKEIEPIRWIKAIRGGMARAHGQNGLKILKQEKIGALTGLKFEVKLLGTPMRLYGHYKNGTWYFEWFDNEHD